MISYAQNFEDVVLARVFKGKADGFYIDIGAHDPDELSVTKHFYNLGWNGINVEPVPKSFNKFLKKRKRDVNLNFAIGRNDEIQKFYSVSGFLKSGLDASALSSFCETNVKEAAKKFDISYEAIEIEKKTLKTICDTYCEKPIDFIKIDVEGFEVDVVEGADFINYRPTIIVIEATAPNSNPLEVNDLSQISTWEDYDKILIRSNYEYVYFDGLNRFYLKNESLKLKHLFSFPISAFDGFIRPERVTLQKENNILNKRLKKLESIVENKNNQIEQLNTKIEDIDNQRKNLEQRQTKRINLLQALLAEKRFLDHRNRRFRFSELCVILKSYFFDLKSFKYIWSIRRSGLFFDNYYQKQISNSTDVSELPIVHYYKNGHNINANPNPLFSTSFYLNNNPDVTNTNINPLFHYIRHGWKEGRNPHAEFNSFWYQSNYQDVAQAGVNPLFHFLKHGIREGRFNKPNSANPIYCDEEYFEKRKIKNARIIVHWGNRQKEILKSDICTRGVKSNEGLTKSGEQQLKVLTFCTFAHGGAGIGTMRRISALRKIGIDAKLISLFTNSDKEHIGRVEPALDGIRTNNQTEIHRYFNQIYNQKIRNNPQYCARELFSPTDSLVTFNQLSSLIVTFDVIHLHWVAGFLDYDTLGKVIDSKPIAWTLADMNAFTGGCHYSEGCNKFQHECKDCPLIGENKNLPHKIWRIKQRAYEELKNLAIICPSEWIANLARQSSLFKNRPIYVIPNAYPTDQFTPVDRYAARKKLSLPLDKKLVLFGADVSSSLRKGSDLLQQTLKIFTANTQNNSGELEAVTFGKSPPQLDMPSHSLGSIDEEQLAYAYSAADLFLSCTREDVGPMTVGESMLCGTPVVGFRSVGLLEEIGIHQSNAYLAEPFDPEDLAEGIRWALQARENDKFLSNKCRETAEKYCDPILAANRHKRVYESMLHSGNI
jgi:FkbM family methyltransferase